MESADPRQADATLAGVSLPPRTFGDGRYRVLRLLGEGGQKNVYLVLDAELDRQCALALLKPNVADPGGVERVKREAKAMARLTHPNIVTVFDIGEEDGRPYTVCEYVSGGDLHQALRQSGEPLPLDRVIAITQDICRALVLTHSRAILHRDIKPGNIWLTDDGTAKLGDFGLAAALEHSRITQLGTVLGTAAYMSPEQALGAPIDARSDLYSLGCVLYEMLTGRPPFLGDDVIAVVSQHINMAPVAASWYRADLPRALDALIERLLAKAPEERPESATQVLQLLAAIAAAPAGASAVVPADANSLERLARGVFVGREAETQQIRSALDRALSGQGNLALLAGEPGIGKTRLAEELATYASVRGAQVLWGRCYEGEGAPAFWPWVQAIRSYVHDRDPAALLLEMGPGAADIAQVVSEVRERLPDLPAPASLEPEQARFRLFDSITTFLKNASNAQPLVFILDDLHWADKPSLLLLQFLARELGGTRLLVVGTYRDVEVRRQHPLSSTLAELAREQLSQRVVLRGLNEGEVARFIEMSCGVAPPEGLVAAVHKDTEGNPFFVKEVVNLLAREGRLQREHPTTSWTVAIPQSVREVVGRRLDGLSEECNRVLTIASVIGREFDLRTLEQITGLSGDTVLDLLEETVAARIVDELPDAVGRYSFSHALIRETLREELTTTRRIRLHRQIAEALERLYADDVEPHLAELAYHFYQAAPGGDLAKAIQYLRRAGDRCVRQFAYDEAVTHYERAAESEADDRGRCELLLALADALARAGMDTRADATFERAGDIALRLSSPDLLVRSALGAEPLGLDRGVSVRLVEAALAALPPGDTVARARCLAHLAPAFGREERGGELSSQAVEMARRLGDRETLAHALTAVYHHLVEAYPLDVRRRLDIASEVLQIATEIGDKELALASGHCDRLQDLIHLGDMAAAEADIEAHARLSLELRQGGQQRHTLSLYTMRSTIAGRFAEAEALAAQALDLGRRMERPDAEEVYFLQMLVLRREQGRLSDLPEHPAGPDEASPGSLLLAARALVHADQDEPDACRRAVEVLFPDGAEDPPSGAGEIVLALLAEACAWLADRTRAAILYDLLVPYADRAITSDGSFIVLGSGSRYLGLLAVTMSRWDEAAQHFEDALAMNIRMGARTWVAHTQHDYAKMLLERGEAGDRERALELVAAALDTAQEMGMKKVIDDCLALQERAQGIEQPRP